MISNLETTGIELLGKENPYILALICKDNFLPPTQLIYALQELEEYSDKEELVKILEHLLFADSISVAKQAAKTLGVTEYLNDGPEPESG